VGTDVKFISGCTVRVPLEDAMVLLGVEALLVSVTETWVVV
jgi:hypothetical protein